MELLYFLLIGLIAGWLAGLLVKGGGFGIVGDMVMGVLGAFLGGFLFQLLSGMISKAMPALPVVFMPNLRAL